MTFYVNSVNGFYMVLDSVWGWDFRGKLHNPKIKNVIGSTGIRTRDARIKTSSANRYTMEPFAVTGNRNRGYSLEANNVTTTPLPQWL